MRRSCRNRRSRFTNSGMVLTRAGEIASVIDREAGGGPQARSAFVSSAFERILGRAPTER